MVRCLLRHRCQVDQQDRHGNTPLHIACKDGNLPVVMAICNAKASLDLPNKVSASTSPQTARIRSLRRSQAALRGLVVSHSFQTQLRVKVEVKDLLLTLRSAPSLTFRH